MIMACSDYGHVGHRSDDRRAWNRHSQVEMGLI